MSLRIYTSAELDRAHAIYDGVQIGQAMSRTTDLKGTSPGWEACRLLARIETLGRRIGALQTAGCNVSLDEKQQRRLEKARRDLREACDDWRRNGSAFTVEWTTSVNCPVNVRANGRDVNKQGVFNG